MPGAERALSRRVDFLDHLIDPVRAGGLDELCHAALAVILRTVRLATLLELVERPGKETEGDDLVPVVHVSDVVCPLPPGSPRFRLRLPRLPELLVCPG